MKALFVYPEYPATFWSFKKALSFVGKKASLPPLGLLTVAAMLPRDWEIRLIDMNVSKLRDRHLKNADIIFVSAMIVQKESTHSVIARAKALGKTIVVGGPYFSSANIDQFPDVDHFLLGEVEDVMLDFLCDIQYGKAHRVYRSLQRPDLSTTPLPRWDLIDLGNYATMSVQYTRGCPFGCEFCDITQLFGRVTRSKTSAKLIAEMDNLYDAGWRGGVFIVDDNFVGNMPVVKAMLPDLITWQKAHKYPFTFLTEASVNLAKDTELMALMREAGFNQVFLGIETPSVESLRECHKGQNAGADLVEVIAMLHSFGMEVLGGFIVGFDNDKPDIFDRQVDFIQKTGVVVAMVGMLNALPGTKLWERLKASGRLRGDSSGNQLASGTNFVPTMGQEALTRGYNSLMAKIYSPKGYYSRIETLFKSLKTVSHGNHVKITDITAFIQSTVRIGVLSRSRFYYWRLLSRHCFDMRKFPMAVRYAIIGEHFMAMAQAIARS